MCGITKVGTLRNENEFFLQQYLTRCFLLRQRNDFWTLVQMTHVMTTSQSDTKVLMILCRWHRKRSNVEAIRRADAEAEKALKRAKIAR